MGVKGLWPLLEPVGRRVNIEALTNKRLAVGMHHMQNKTRMGLEKIIFVYCDKLSVATPGDGEVLRDGTL